MTKKLLFVITILLVIVTVAFAADAITGKWVYEQPMGRGGMGGGGGAGAAPPAGAAAMPPRIVTLDLKADGANLTGTILQPAFGGRGGGGGGAAPAPAAAPTPTPISKGTVSGNKITFEVTVDRGNGPQTTTYEGTVSGAELQLKITRQGQNGPTTQDVVAKHPAS